jgi:hypothetical protein
MATSWEGRGLVGSTEFMYGLRDLLEMMKGLTVRDQNPHQKISRMRRKMRKYNEEKTISLGA